MSRLPQFVFFCSNQDNRGYEELVAPDFIETVTAPSLDDKAYDEFKFQRTQVQREDQNFPFDNTHQGKPHIQRFKCLMRRKMSLSLAKT